MVLAIAFMYLCCTLLIPFIVFAMWCAFSGDVMRERDAAARVAARLDEHTGDPVAFVDAPRVELTA